MTTATTRTTRTTRQSPHNQEITRKPEDTTRTRQNACCQALQQHGQDAPIHFPQSTSRIREHDQFTKILSSKYWCDVARFRRTRRLPCLKYCQCIASLIYLALRETACQCKIIMHCATAGDSSNVFPRLPLSTNTNRFFTLNVGFAVRTPYGSRCVSCFLS